MNTEILSNQETQKIKTCFGLACVPFTNGVWATKMYNSSSQTELGKILEVWLDIKGFALVIGPAGIGKSISIRRFVKNLDTNRFQPFELTASCPSPNGFLRHLSRKLARPLRQYTSDLFDDIQTTLTSHEDETGLHPILLLDDADTIKIDVLEILRKLSTSELDCQNRFSVLLAGTERLKRTLDSHLLEPLRSRIGIAHHLKPFAFEDTIKYIKFHLDRAKANPDLFDEEAMRHIFQISRGKPRIINQLAICVMAYAAVWGKNKIDARFCKNIINDNPLFGKQSGEL